jgi:hypothetical protein
MGKPVYHTFRGLTMNVAQWGRHMKHGTGTIATRVRKGWSLERAIFTPNTLPQRVRRPAEPVDDPVDPNEGNAAWRALEG